MITVGIVDDNAGIRRGFERLLAMTPGFKCICSCSSGEEALQVIPKKMPDVLLMDIEMPGMTGIECTYRLMSLLPQIRIVMITVCNDNDNVFQALQAGASGYLLKRSSPDEIIEAISDVYAGGSPMSSAIARKVVEAFRIQPPGKATGEAELSPREKALLDLISSGKSNKEAADALKLTYSTVREYLKKIYDKLHVHSRTDAVIKYLGRPLVL